MNNSLFPFFTVLQNHIRIYSCNPSIRAEGLFVFVIVFVFVFVFTVLQNHIRIIRAIRVQKKIEKLA